MSTTCSSDVLSNNSSLNVLTNDAANSVSLTPDTALLQQATNAPAITTLIKPFPAALCGHSRHSRNCKRSEHIRFLIVCSRTSRSLNAFLEPSSTGIDHYSQHDTFCPRRRCHLQRPPTSYGMYIREPRHLHYKACLSLRSCRSLVSTSARLADRKRK